jgi:hypothetical protein
MVFTNTMKNAVVVLLTCTLLFPFTGCASIMHGKTEQIKFTSSPPGATVQVGSQTGITPTSLILNRRGKYVARFSKEGCEPKEVKMKEGMSMWFLLGNVVFGGIPGWIIDAINGSIGDLSPDNVHANMVCK